MGLLSKASFISQDTLSDTKLAFSEFVFRYNIQTFAIFQLSNNYYSVENSIGFDGASLRSSVSTMDFWNGICPELSRAYTFPCNEVEPNPIIQFFSFQIRDDIKYISIYRTDRHIFLLCNKDFSGDIISDMQNIDAYCDNINLDKLNKTITKNSKILLYTINFEEAVNHYISERQGIRKNNNVFFRISLYNELVNRFSCVFSKYGTKRLSDNNINVFINVDKCIHENHIILHITFLLKNIIGRSAELINFEKVDIADSLVDIKDFLQVD